MNSLIAIPPFHQIDRSLIYVRGSDAAEFLQGQISNDVELLSQQSAIHALILTPQGKILADLFVYNYQNGYLLDVHSSISEWLLKRFNMFKLRSDVNFENISDQLQVMVSMTALENTVVSAADPRLDFVIRNVVKQASVETTAKVYQMRLASNAITEFGTDYLASEHFPQDLWFDKLGSVSFTKGCYVGQEVVSRMRHKSSARKRVLPLIAKGQHKKGDKILLQEKSVGEVMCQIGNIVLGMMRTDKLADDRTKLDEFQIMRPAWTQN